MYYVISQFDRDADVQEMTKEEVLEFLDEDVKPKECLSKLEQSSPAYWGERYLIIKGEIVTPKAKEVVVEYELE
jgi:hypothetical protein